MSEWNITHTPFRLPKNIKDLKSVSRIYTRGLPSCLHITRYIGKKKFISKLSQSQLFGLLFSPDQVPASYHHAVSSNHLNYSGGTPHNFLSHSYTPSSTYACAVERSSSYKNHNSNIINKQSDHSNHQPINGYPGLYT